MSTRVRKAMVPDAPALLNLVRAHAAFERGEAPLSFGELETILSADDPPTHLLVAEGHTALVGYAAVTFDFSLWQGCPYGHLDCLFVVATARGRGIGRQLFDAAVRLAQAEDIDRLEWQTPLWNKDAIRFYSRTGALGVTKERFAIPLR
ncbi:GNAT family N-acetyltransferase [Methylobacterium sp. W2]|uniref:GNAT family N-acetyltransferase n=1 Tax=Methylobacterium sp. W2 TaxID=2598107 RepID=UPI001D0CBCF8|nr:GNAT family N-acetyltransferase [Methylobacterium sp. W2]MCC0805573.1 GNAT family N-acetyltransferase [Methylobacterium sp. W2]